MHKKCVEMYLYIHENQLVLKIQIFLFNFGKHYFNLELGFHLKQLLLPWIYMLINLK